MNKTLGGLLLLENNQWKGGVIRSVMKWSYCYQPKVDIQKKTGNNLVFIIE